MNYCVEIYDPWNRRIAVYDEVPLMDVIVRTPDQDDCLEGLLPKEIPDIGPGYRIRVLVEENVFAEGIVETTTPQWSDAKKLILDKYVSFHEVVAFEARRRKTFLNAPVSGHYAHRTIDEIFKTILHDAPSPIHYLLDHSAYPDGAEREFHKFLARKNPDNAFSPGNFSGQWIGPPLLDAASASAKDGGAITGVLVDGSSWPDIRLMMTDVEEISRNARAIKRHPEVADWTDAQYAASPYRRRAENARAFLQRLIEEHGIDFIELNPHRNAAGQYDDRIDAEGRISGLVYGQGLCFNAALIEQGLAGVDFRENGRYLAPEMQLKDFFSYTGPHASSLETSKVVLENVQFAGGILELMTALAYMAGGGVFSVDQNHAVSFRHAIRPDRVVYFDPRLQGIQLGAHAQRLCNSLLFSGNPLTGVPEKTYTRSDSVDNYGAYARPLEYFSAGAARDADRLASGLLDDLAYPEPNSTLTWYAGDNSYAIGDLVEIRGESLRRLDRELPGEWGGRFTSRIMGRIREIGHRFTGKQTSTTIRFTSPLSSVTHPLHFIVAGQPTLNGLFAFRLDDTRVGMDIGFHLD